MRVSFIPDCKLLNCDRRVGMAESKRFILNKFMALPILQAMIAAIISS